ncbi:MAG TPA: hypothetical protein PL190_07065 [Caldisericia bacterium]|nr:MAG: hypothetical protein BWX90_01303 [bacterium ADurb.Bin132]HNW31396.1 hypothetical protein [Caldisericia bacterium]HNY61849.1 hypothetical protein [Caldisericia bacterium]HOC79624.1 hypothetical protein [Caldisericia bacterium]HOG70915.1 hypothetical protein [Caldisericia bacterium]
MSAVGQTGARANKYLIYWVAIILVFGSLVSAAIILDPGRAKLKLVASNTDREIVGYLYGDPKDTSRRYLPVVFDKSDGGLRIFTEDLKETLTKIGSSDKLLSINIKKDPIPGSHDTSTTNIAAIFESYTSNVLVFYKVENVHTVFSDYYKYFEKAFYVETYADTIIGRYLPFDDNKTIILCTNKRGEVFHYSNTGELLASYSLGPKTIFAENYKNGSGDLIGYDGTNLIFYTVFREKITPYKKIPLGTRGDIEKSFICGNTKNPDRGIISIYDGQKLFLFDQMESRFVFSIKHDGVRPGLANMLFPFDRGLFFVNGCVSYYGGKQQAPQKAVYLAYDDISQTKNAKLLACTSFNENGGENIIFIVSYESLGKHKISAFKTRVFDYFTSEIHYLSKIDFEDTPEEVEAAFFDSKVENCTLYSKNSVWSFNVVEAFKNQAPVTLYHRVCKYLEEK